MHFRRSFLVRFDQGVVALEFAGSVGPLFEEVFLRFGLGLSDQLVDFAGDFFFFEITGSRFIQTLDVGFPHLLHQTHGVVGRLTEGTGGYVKTDSQSLKVPLRRAHLGLIEIVETPNGFPLGTSEGAGVECVGVAEHGHSGSGIGEELRLVLVGGVKVLKKQGWGRSEEGVTGLCHEKIFLCRHLLR